jgi:hypothetical protein
LELLRSIRAHDRQLAEAASQARRERYAAALNTLAAARRALAGASAVRDQTAAAGRGTDALDTLIDPLVAQDRAIAVLYTRLDLSGGVLTREVEAALAGVRRAQEDIPPRAEALAAAIGEAGGDEVVPALLRIEDVRGTIELAAQPPPDASGGTEGPTAPGEVIDPASGVGELDG